jgi:hypothetical protein
VWASSVPRSCRDLSSISEIIIICNYFYCFESRVLRRIFGPKRDEAKREWKNYIMRSLMICTPHPIFFGRFNREE